jgi:hypothetical protein
VILLSKEVLRESQSLCLLSFFLLSLRFATPVHLCLHENGNECMCVCVCV